MLPTEVAILLDPSLSQIRLFLLRITDHHRWAFASAVRRKLTSGGQTKVVKARTITRTRVTELAELRDVEGQLDRPTRSQSHFLVDLARAPSQR